MSTFILVLIIKEENLHSLLIITLDLLQGMKLQSLQICIEFSFKLIIIIE